MRLQIVSLVLFGIIYLGIASSLHCEENQKGSLQMIENGSLEFKNNGNEKSSLPGWKLIPIEAAAEIFPSQFEKSDGNSVSAVRIQVKGLSDHGAVVFENGGKKFFSVKKNESCLLTFYAKATGEIRSLNITIPKLEGSSLAQNTVKNLNGNWKKYEIVLKPTEDYQQCRLCFLVNRPGSIGFAEVSLVPKK